MERDFKWIWIPKEVWLSKDLTLQEKVFFVEIDSLDNKDWCFAWNAYFADFFNLSKTRVSLVIKSLIDKWYITSKIIYKDGTKEILKRVLKKSYGPYLIKVKDPIKEKLKDNNIINNTSNNIINNIYKPKDKSLGLAKINNFDIDMSTLFIKNQLELNNPSFIYLYNKQNENELINKWADEIRKLREIDKYTEEQITYIINYLFTNDFWRNQICTLWKLRKKNKTGIPYFIVLINELKKQKEWEKEKSRVWTAICSVF